MERVGLVGQQCPRCGCERAQTRRARRAGSPSRVVKVYTGVLVLWAIVFPFLVPLLFDTSKLNP